MQQLHIVAAISTDGFIGNKLNQLPWHLPNDLQRFKALTKGHAVIMGRNTYFSLTSGALHDRANIVVSQSLYKGSGLYDAAVSPTFGGAVAMAEGYDRIFAIGGTRIFAAAAPFANYLHITRVDCVVGNGVPFPDIQWGDFDIQDVAVHPPDSKHRHGYQFVTYKRTRKWAAENWPWAGHEN